MCLSRGLLHIEMQCGGKGVHCAAVCAQEWQLSCLEGTCPFASKAMPFLFQTLRMDSGSSDSLAALRMPRVKTLKCWHSFEMMGG